MLETLEEAIEVASQGDNTYVVLSLNYAKSILAMLKDCEDQDRLTVQGAEQRSEEVRRRAARDAALASTLARAAADLLTGD